MYGLQSIYNGLRNPAIVARVIEQKYTKLRHSCEWNPGGFSIFDEDWDNLIILDACRYDTFDQLASIPGTTDSKISRASATSEFVRSNFSEKKNNDVVYITVNSWYTTLRHEINCEVHELVDIQYGLGDDTAVDSHFEITRPEAVTKKAHEVNKKFPNKRLLIHYLQPHHPFIGEFGRELFRHKSSSLPEVLEECDHQWTREDVVRAYEENLEIVLKEVKELLPALQGLTAITADHGELLGEAYEMTVGSRTIASTGPEYGHPPGYYHPKLVTVPWHEYRNGKRKSIVSEKSCDRTQYRDKEKLEQQLAKLGYK